jgi:hypothetical protein
MVIEANVKNESKALAFEEIAPLHRGLLVIVGAEAFSSAEITELSSRGHAVGRLSVDVDVEPLVDQTSVQSGQLPSLT